ncbi:MAG: ATP-binding cassette domain-containing protein [Gammaproteobacteria bacterium]
MKAPRNVIVMGDTPVIRTEGLTFGWRKNAPPVLVISTLAVSRNERVFIKGPSGSGKSTLLSLIGGVVVPREGEITVLGRNIGELAGARRDSFRADHIGFIFQMFNLIPYLSIVDNVLLPCRFSPARRDRLLQRGVTLQQEAVRLLTRLELGEDLFERPVTELSIGQQQRAAAARALIGQPDILIADEPTSALDAGTRESFLNLLFEECAAQHITVVFVSHDSSLEPLFDRTIELDTINETPAVAPASMV